MVMKLKDPRRNRGFLFIRLVATCCINPQSVEFFYNPAVHAADDSMLREMILQAHNVSITVEIHCIV